MENAEAKSSKQIHIFITQLVTVGLILITVITIKYFFKDTYTQLKAWYEKSICNDTSINEVLQEKENGYEI